MITKSVKAFLTGNLLLLFCSMPAFGLDWGQASGGTPAQQQPGQQPSGQFSNWVQVSQPGGTQQQPGTKTPSATSSTQKSLASQTTGSENKLNALTQGPDCEVTSVAPLVAGGMDEVIVTGKRLYANCQTNFTDSVGNVYPTKNAIMNNDTLKVIVPVNMPPGAGALHIVSERAHKEMKFLPFTVKPRNGCTYQVIPNTDLDVSREQGSSTYEVRTDSGCAWIVEASSWLTITSGARGTGNGTVHFSWGKNEIHDGYKRHGTLTIAGEKRQINQQAAAAEPKNR